jgi:hypothetical protein
MVGSLGLNWTHRQSLYATMPRLPEKGPERDRGNSPAVDLAVNLVFIFACQLPK